MLYDRVLILSFNLSERSACAALSDQVTFLLEGVVLGSWADKGGDFKKFSYGSETLYMTCEGLGEIFEGD